MARPSASEFAPPAFATAKFSKPARFKRPPRRKFSLPADRFPMKFVTFPRRQCRSRRGCVAGRSGGRAGERRIFGHAVGVGQRRCGPCQDRELRQEPAGWIHSSALFRAAACTGSSAAQADLRGTQLPRSRRRSQAGDPHGSDHLREVFKHRDRSRRAHRASEEFSQDRITRPNLRL